MSFNNTPFGHDGSTNAQRLANFHHIQQLTLQNRILKARQQNLFYKTQLGQLIIDSSRSVTNQHAQPQLDRMAQPPHSILHEQRPPYKNEILNAPILESKSARLVQSVRDGSHQRMIVEQDIHLQPVTHRGDLGLEQTTSTTSRLESFPEPSFSLPNRTMPQKAFQLENSSSYHKVLGALAKELEVFVDDTSNLLQKETSESLSKDQKAQKAQREESKQNRQNIESLLKKQNATMRLPLWRHKLAGILNPPKSQIIGGSRLFRCVVLSVIAMIIRPSLTISGRELKRMQTFRKEFDKTLIIVLESISDWLGKIVQLPITSIVQDETIDFSSKEGFSVGSTVPFKSRMVQLKVRLKTIVNNITSSFLPPPPHITNLLIALVNDRVYFPVGFLWECEIRNLEFSKLGATRNMVPCLEDVEEGVLKSEVQFLDGTIKVYDGRRVRMMLINVLLVRILIGKIFLSPWKIHLCAAPSRSMHRVEANLQILASIFYCFLQDLNHYLPEVTADQNFFPTKRSEDMTAKKAGKTFLRHAFKMFSHADDNKIGTAQKSGELPSEDTVTAASSKSLESIENLKSLLLPRKSLESIESLIVEWKGDCIQSLSHWIDSLTRHVVEALNRQGNK